MRDILVPRIRMSMIFSSSPRAWSSLVIGANIWVIWLTMRLMYSVKEAPMTTIGKHAWGPSESDHNGIGIIDDFLAYIRDERLAL